MDESSGLAVTPALARPSRLARLGSTLRRLKGPIAAVAAVGAVLSGLLGYWNTYRTVRDSVAPAASVRTLPKDAGPVSIVVLPFTNLTGDPTQAHVADGMTASVTADLSRIIDAFVVGTGTALAYQNKPLTAQQVGQELGVRFVLQGNVQRSGNQIRINAQLSDTQSNAQLWSESFEGDGADLFALQDKVTTLIGNTMGHELVVRAARESELRKSSQTVADLMLRIHSLVLKPTTPEFTQKSEALCRQVLALEPDNIGAMQQLAASLMIQVTSMMVTDEKRRAAMVAEATALAARIQAAEPESGPLQFILSMLARHRGDGDAALQALERLVVLVPKTPATHINLAQELVFHAEPQRAQELLLKAQSLDPKRLSDGLAIVRTQVEFMLGHYDAAIEWGLKARAISPSFSPGDPTLALAYALKGDTVRAKAEREASLKIDPSSTISQTLHFFEDPANHHHPAYVRWVRETVVPAMRLAGFPE